MEVLKQRNGKRWFIDIECTGKGNGDEGRACGSKLRITTDDIYKTEHIWLDGSVDSCYTTFCPICGTETDIASSKIGIAESVILERVREFGNGRAVDGFYEDRINVIRQIKQIKVALEQKKCEVDDRKHNNKEVLVK